MATDRRWEAFRNDKEFLAIFKDPELVELSKLIFGYIPGTMQLVKPQQTLFDLTRNRNPYISSVLENTVAS